MVLFEACIYSSGLFVIRFLADCVKFKLLLPLSHHLTCEQGANCNGIVIFFIDACLESPCQAIFCFAWLSSSAASD